LRCYLNAIVGARCFVVGLYRGERCLRYERRQVHLRFRCSTTAEFRVPAAACDTILEGCSIEIFHRDKTFPLMLGDLVNRKDVGMMKRRSKIAGQGPSRSSGPGP